TLPIREIVKILTAGKVKDREITIKILEGWDSAEIADYLAKQGLFKSPDFLKFVGLPKTDYRKRKDLTTPKDFSEQFPFLKDKPIYYGLEGYLFPDTYRIYKDATIEEVVVKMLDNFDKKLTAELRAEIARQKKTIYEIIIMASILEKEVRTPEDMQIVAGIFWKRLENNYPLESCATLAFILGVNKPQYSVEDTKLRSPYNTYLNQGLPPGPISNPGIEAIKAAIYPKDSPYHYFLSRLDTGETVFSQTYSEHLQNKAKYLK
ncbi:MAG: endolytic transglycosylase MltG, partial [Candidatus Falkowbacteria bacterium]|nr:endolytic transglycosylase MltG [Candidatus Falkowbacteria bacterium]